MEASPYIAAMSKTQQDDWRKQWREQCRRQLKRPTLTRIKYGFAYVYKPVLDDGPSRAFDTMAEYRRWCARTWPATSAIGLHPAPMPKSKFTSDQALAVAGKAVPIRWQSEDC